ncbi:MAG: heme-binding protein [Planctomycetes bacterium]|nr:heme-binding protein [Planctomycetota bacterium]
MLKLSGWLTGKRGPAKGRRRARRNAVPATTGSGAAVEALEPRAMMAAAQLSTSEVAALLDRASAATPSTDAIIAIVDRSGRILGVRTEDQVTATITDKPMLAFAIDGAVAKARTGAFFSNGQGILTSRTVSHISQSTITQREMQANPNAADQTVKGPGWVAPVGIGGEFPPGILRTPLVDLFAIEHTNRTSIVVDGKVITNRASYGQQSGTLPGSIGRGIATLPGGVAIYRAGTDEVIGGIGVFFPGRDGTAAVEQGFRPVASQTRADRLNAPKALEAEAIALATLLPVSIPGTVTPLTAPLHVTLTPAVILNRAGGPGASVPMSMPQAQNLVNRVNTAARINLGGIALQSFGPQAGPSGVQTIFSLIAAQGNGPINGLNQQVFVGGQTLLDGKPQADGWLVAPRAGSLLSAADVKRIVDQGVAEAVKTRAQIRVQPTFTKMVLGVADTNGDVLGLFRMPDATVFSIDVAVAKSRNTVYYASANLQPQDQVAGVPLGTAFTNRTFRYLAVPKYPSGNATGAPAPFSILNEPGIDPATGLNVGAPRPASSFTTVLGFDSFNPGRNFSCPFTVMPKANQNGIVFFPGSSAAYVGSTLAGGFGVSGDGVDQDDVVTYYGIAGYAAPEPIQAWQYFVRGIRLPYMKFSRNPGGGS